MNFIKKILAFSLATAGALFAETVDLFYDYVGSSCISKQLDLHSTKCYDQTGTPMASKVHKARLRVIDPPALATAPFGFYLERPFFIIDGIHLSTDEKRTLSQLQAETEEFGIPEMLKSLGYTPVLVQFSQTVIRSLQQNSETFAGILDYLEDNRQIPFPNKKQDGFVILGISQGGIIGRYGSYLYDTRRDKANSAPVRFFASLDSPHQGAVMPRGLVASIDFWANEAEVASAEAFYDLISAPGARDLLIYDTEAGNSTYQPKTGAERFLFGDYRKAAEYKGFPVVLVAQGQLKGKDPAHKNKYYDLERRTELLSKVMGRATSSLSYSTAASGEYAHNRKYEFNTGVDETSKKGVTDFDFVQGSTYPFAKTLYESLRDGMEEAMPKNWDKNVKVGGITVASFPMKSYWNNDTLYQASSTFIPTVSAMDLKCDGDLAIRKSCVHSQKASDLSFEKPGSRSTAKAIYAVDSSHPRYGEAMSGRHIESPMDSKGNVDKKVLSGMQTDIWRVLCEVAKADYNSVTGQFRNPKLGGFFSPNTSCMDQTKMPAVIKNGGVLQTKKLGYIRYDYNTAATEGNAEVTFALPAGWQKVAVADKGFDVPPSSIFEVEVRVQAPQSNWMKAELLLTQRKDGGLQVQFAEQDIPQDGLFHTIRWQMPSTAGALKSFRWFRLVLNSKGGMVTLRRPRLVVNANNFEEIPTAIPSAKVYPNASYRVVPWSDTVMVKDYSDGLGAGVAFEFKSGQDGVYLDLKKPYSMEAYKSLKVEYWPGTCVNTSIFFDAKSKKDVNLGNNRLQNGFVVKILPLSDLVNTDVTPKGSLSASRLGLQAMKAGEKCIVRSITLE
jgi:hypothetical protein